MSSEATAQQWAAVPSADLSCNINGIPIQTRVHYHQLFAAIIRAIDETRELPEGHAFRINERITPEQLVEWVNLERKCCSFFGFQIVWEPKNGPLWLHLTGPQGVKDFILDELGLR